MIKAERREPAAAAPPKPRLTEIEDFSEAKRTVKTMHVALDAV